MTMREVSCKVQKRYKKWLDKEAFSVLTFLQQSLSSAGRERVHMSQRSRRHLVGGPSGRLPQVPRKRDPTQIEGFLGFPYLYETSDK